MRTRLVKSVSGPDPKPKKAKRVKKEKKEKVHKHPVALKVFKTVLLVFLCLAMTGILSVGSVVGYVFLYIENLANGDVIIDLNEYMENQQQTTIVYANDSDGNLVELTRLHGVENRIWVSYDEIPKTLINAYIAIEDKRFYDHKGVDWIRTIGGVISSKLTQGGSTITQQLIKNLTGENGRTFYRKFNEIIKALNLERNFSKETIMETYLNTLYLDAGCYGVETAAEYYFGKTVDKLNLAECACIAAITKAPRDYNPIINFETNRERQIDCLYYMLEQGKISQQEYDEAKNYQLVFTGNSKVVQDSLLAMDEDDVSDEDNEKSDVQSYYVDYVIDQVIEHLMEQYDMSSSQAWRKVYYGGLNIYTAVDLDVQKEMEDVYYNRIGMTSDEEDMQSAMAVVDYSGRLVGIVGKAGEKTVNRALNIASDSPRQPGSSIKPLSVYAPGIDGDYITWSSKIKNYGIMINGSLWPYNYGGDSGSPTQYITVQQAIAPSYNTVPARLVEKLGIDYCYKYLTENFHLGHLTENDKAYAPIAVGGMSYGVTCLEMAGAYASFGNGGIYYEPCSYYTVTSNKDTKVWLQKDTQGQQAVEPGTADVMQELMRTVVTSSNGTARKWYVDGFETIAKTGTTTDNKDSWFVGGTPYYLAAVWYGYAEHPQELENIGGNSPSGRMFQIVMNRIHEGLDGDKEFYKSGEAEQRTYCTGSGNLATSGCASTARGWYKLSNIPSSCTGCFVYGDGESTSETDTGSDTSVTGVTDNSNTSVAPTSPTTRVVITTQIPTVIIDDNTDRDDGDR